MSTILKKILKKAHRAITGASELAKPPKRGRGALPDSATTAQSVEAAAEADVPTKTSARYQNLPPLHMTTRAAKRARETEAERGETPPKPEKSPEEIPATKRLRITFKNAGQNAREEVALASIKTPSTTSTTSSSTSNPPIAPQPASGSRTSSKRKARVEGPLDSPEAAAMGAPAIVEPPAKRQKGRPRKNAGPSALPESSLAPAALEAPKAPKRAPGRPKKGKASAARRAAVPRRGAQVEADAQRSRDLKSNYRAVLSALTPALAVLAERTMAAIEGDPEGYNNEPNFKSIQTQLDRKLSQAIAKIETQYQYDKTNEDKKLAFEAESIQRSLTLQLEDIKERTELGAKDAILEAIRQRKAAADGEGSVVEEDPVLRGKPRMSRSQYLVEQEQAWKSMLRREALGHAMLAYAPENEEHIFDFATRIVTDEDIQDHADRLLALAAASGCLDSSPEAIINNGRANGLDLLADAVDKQPRAEMVPEVASVDHRETQVQEELLQETATVDHQDTQAREELVEKVASVDHQDTQAREELLQEAASVDHQAKLTQTNGNMPSSKLQSGNDLENGQGPAGNTRSRRRDNNQYPTSNIRGNHVDNNQYPTSVPENHLDNNQNPPSQPNENRPKESQVSANKSRAGTQDVPLPVKSSSSQPPRINKTDNTVDTATAIDNAAEPNTAAAAVPSGPVARERRKRPTAKKGAGATNAERPLQPLASKPMPAKPAAVSKNQENPSSAPFQPWDGPAMSFPAEIMSNRPTVPNGFQHSPIHPGDVYGRRASAAIPPPIHQEFQHQSNHAPQFADIGPTRGNSRRPIVQNHMNLGYPFDFSAFHQNNPPMPPTPIRSEAAVSSSHSYHHNTMVDQFSAIQPREHRHAREVLPAPRPYSQYPYTQGYNSATYQNYPAQSANPYGQQQMQPSRERFEAYPTLPPPAQMPLAPFHAYQAAPTHRAYSFQHTLSVGNQTIHQTARQPPHQAIHQTTYQASLHTAPQPKMAQPMDHATHYMMQPQQIPNGYPNPSARPHQPLDISQSNRRRQAKRPTQSQATSLPPPPTPGIPQTYLFSLYLPPGETSGHNERFVPEYNRGSDYPDFTLQPRRA
ncbi:MAG: hypothetical protein M1829_001306 [Trizodia sp. TS-e1964]|nr:MAG: hypothetical protein M1829_001306 [Trizodia sp. TS-e1964]